MRSPAGLSILVSVSGSSASCGLQASRSCVCLNYPGLKAWQQEGAHLAAPGSTSSCRPACLSICAFPCRPLAPLSVSTHVARKHDIRKPRTWQRLAPLPAAAQLVPPRSPLRCRQGPLDPGPPCPPALWPALRRLTPPAVSLSRRMEQLQHPRCLCNGGCAMQLPGGHLGSISRRAFLVLTSSCILLVAY